MVGSWEEFGGAHFGWGVLGVVEDLEVVDFGAPFGAAVSVPFLCGLGAFDAVAAHEDGESEFLSEEAAYGACNLGLADDVLDEPVFVEDVARLVVDVSGAGFRRIRWFVG